MMVQLKDSIPIEYEDAVKTLSSYFTAVVDEILMISFRFVSFL